MTIARREIGMTSTIRRRCSTRIGHLSAGVLSSLLAVGCSKGAPEKKDAPKAPASTRIALSAAAVESARVKVEPVVLQTIEEDLPLSGTLGYDENRVAHVAPRVGGRVARILADFGQPVRAGQALAEIDSPELGEALAQWRKSRSVLGVRERELERAKKLREGKAISEGELLSREGEFRVAKAEFDNADSRLHLFGLTHAESSSLTSQDEVSSQFPLRSPIGGKVIDRQINPGAVVEVGKPLFTVGDITTLWLVAQLYEKDLARVHAGQAVTVATAAFPSEIFPGRIDYVGDQVETSTRTVRARAVIHNPGGRLKPGMFVEARLSLPSLEPALAVPSAALQEIDKAPTVFVEVAPNEFEPRRVETGTAGHDLTEIRKGLRAGEKVVSRGSLTLKAAAQKAALGEE